VFGKGHSKIMADQDMYVKPKYDKQDDRDIGNAHKRMTGSRVNCSLGEDMQQGYSLIGR
jgi:hypothetical protein